MKNKRFKSKDKISEMLKSKFNKKRVLAICLTLLAGGAVTTKLYNDEHLSDEYVIAITNDKKTDEYNNCIPMSISGNRTLKVDDNSVVLVKGKIKEYDKENNVIYCNNGSVVSGKIEGEYLEKSGIQLSPEEFKKYNKIYKVLPEYGVNLRSDTILENGNIIQGIKKDEWVLGADMLLTKSNEYIWRPVIYVNENGINKGYIKKDYLQEVGSLNKNDAKELDSKDSYIEEASDVDENLTKRKINTSIDDSEEVIALNCCRSGRLD